MTFDKFQSIVQSKRPDLIVHPHGAVMGNGVKIAVQFKPNGKLYCYAGSYAQVLNRLGINAIYRSEYDDVKRLLQYSIESHGKETFFGVYDGTEDIARYTEQLARYDREYIII